MKITYDLSTNNKLEKIYDKLMSYKSFIDYAKKKGWELPVQVCLKNGTHLWVTYSGGEKICLSCGKTWGEEEDLLEIKNFILNLSVDEENITVKGHCYYDEKGNLMNPG